MESESSWFSRPVYAGSYLKNNSLISYVTVVLIGVPILRRQRDLPSTNWPFLLAMVGIGLLAAFFMDWYLRTRTRRQFELIEAKGDLSSSPITDQRALLNNIILCTAIFLFTLTVGLLQSASWLALIYIAVSIARAMSPKALVRVMAVHQPKLWTAFTGKSVEFKMKYAVGTIATPVHLLFMIILFSSNESLLWTPSPSTSLSNNLIAIVIIIYFAVVDHFIIKLKVKCMSENSDYADFDKAYRKKSLVLFLIAYFLFFAVFLVSHFQGLIQYS